MLGSLRSGAEERFWKKIPEHARGKNGVFSQTLTTYFWLLTSLIVSLAWKTPLANLFTPTGSSDFFVRDFQFSEPFSK
jgi:hypothetical protein